MSNNPICPICHVFLTSDVTSEGFFQYECPICGMKMHAPDEEWNKSESKRKETEGVKDGSKIN